MSLAQIDRPPSESDLQSDSLLRTAETALRGKVMIVDDEPIIVRVVQKYLRNAGYSDFATTTDSREAIRTVREQQPDLIIMDVMMPHITGLQLLEVIKGDRNLCHIPVLILTAAADENTKSEALELGATDFLTKPLKPSELAARVKNALVVKAHHDQMAAYSKRLELDVQARTAELLQSRTELIHVLARAAESRDKETGNHVLRVGRYTAIIARELGFSDTQADMLGQAAILHDVGKIGVPDSILLKPGKLDDDEFTEMKRHCEYGRNILRPIHDGDADEKQPGLATRSPMLELAAIITLSHHEKFDGSGYPLGLSGHDIPLEGRITAVADVFDALNSRRPYKEAMPLEKSFAILEEGRGTHFDPMVLDAFFARIEEIVLTMRELADPVEAEA